MRQRGRKSGAALAIADDSNIGPSQLMVPTGLTDAERAVWLATINSKPADWFGSEHVPVLVEYCRHVCRGDIIAGVLVGFEEVIDTEEGLRRYEKLTAIAYRNASLVQRLACSMRLTHQSAWRPDKRVDAKSGRKLWQREQKAA